MSIKTCILTIRGILWGSTMAVYDQCKNELFCEVVNSELVDIPLPRTAIVTIRKRKAGYLPWEMQSVSLNKPAASIHVINQPDVGYYNEPPQGITISSKSLDDPNGLYEGFLNLGFTTNVVRNG
jgi:hypothetical protein